MIRGRLTVGMVVGCTVTPLFDALAAFHRSHPGVEISLLEDNSDRLIEGVGDGTIDLALVGTASAAPQGLDTLTIISERLVVAVPAGHPLAERERLRLRDLAAYPIVCMPPGTGLRTVFDQACAAQQLQPVIALQATAADAIADLAARGLAVGILSASMAARYRDRLIARTVEDLAAPALLALICKNPRSPAVRELLVHSRQAFTAPDGRQAAARLR
ncbi:LysR substrate-binding domain-containing protein [Micromonospora sp. GCM10011542]|uniref:LysR substrate-binding domain-containing protein n=1 Tax=Micromonospora sp. GCM10011542 TaxID=3317337 RepID=UPI00360693BE